MAETFGKCTNFASCTLAYRNEPIAYSGNPVCPECGQPLKTGAGGKGPSPMLLIVGAVGLILLLGGGGFFFFSRHSQKTASTTPVHTEETPATPSPATPEPEPTPVTPPVVAETPSNPPSVDPPKPSPGLTPEPTSPNPPAQTPPVTPAEDKPDKPLVAVVTPPNPVATPSPLVGLMPDANDPAESVSVEKNVDTNLKGEENQRVRDEVLKRIDLMPNLTKAEREKLISRVDHAHGMGKIINIPFAVGSRAVGPREIEQLKTALKAPQVVNLTKVPTVVFVLLGFADVRGDLKTNQKISLDRAENISQTLKEKCGLQNVTQPVGMGGSALFDSGNFAKNRVVEVWAVVP